MCDFLRFEADLQTMQIISNSLMVGNNPNSVNRDMERRKYMPKVGYLVPDRNEKLNNVSDFRSLQQALEGSHYEEMLKLVSSGDDRNEAESTELTIDEVMLTEASRRYSIGFEGGFHVGCFFSYLKLKEQEIKNVTWLAELVQMQVARNLPGWNKFISPFMYHRNDLIAK